MDVHIPTTSRVTELVCNAVTVDYAISRVFDVPDYANHVTYFAEQWIASNANPSHCSAPKLDEQGWFSPEDSSVYMQHIQGLRALDSQTLSQKASQALTGCIDSIHLFFPKQCNMACTGCYASAVPVDKHPFQAADVERYYSDARRIIDEARALGATIVQTSGDGESTIHPHFFDLLEHISSRGMQWLIFTAGLIFSSELAAAQHWQGIAHYLSDHIRSRIQAHIDGHSGRGDAKPTVRAFLDELDRHKDHLHIYHSVWSARADMNTEWRKPRFGDYDYVKVETRGRSVTIPSSLFDFMRIFSDDYRRRLGIDFPVSDASVVDIPAMASFVVDNSLRSYFEPIILTGRARRGVIGGQRGNGAVREQEGLWEDVQSLLVRSLCSFRFIHQPIVKFRPGRDNGFFAVPGTGYDLDNLASIGVLDSVRIKDGALFGAIRSPLIVHANYRESSGCKCNDFASRMLNDKAGLAKELQGVVAASRSLSPNIARLLNGTAAARGVEAALGA
jgi:organic radical activating enzyme